MGKLILTSYGIHTPLGYQLIFEHIDREMLEQKKILLIALPEYEIDARLVQACMRMGFEEKNIHVLKPENAEKIRKEAFDVIYISEGNTFETLDFIRQCDMIPFIRTNVENGAEYIGASAGAHIAGLDIKAALPFDRNWTAMTDFEALKLFPGIAIPHYDAREIQRYLVYKEAKESRKYEVIYTIGNDEVLVIA